MTEPRPVDASTFQELEREGKLYVPNYARRCDFDRHIGMGFTARALPGWAFTVRTCEHRYHPPDDTDRLTQAVYFAALEIANAVMSGTMTAAHLDHGVAVPCYRDPIAEDETEVVVYCKPFHWPGKYGPEFWEKRDADRVNS